MTKIKKIIIKRVVTELMDEHFISVVDQDDYPINKRSKCGISEACKAINFDIKAATRYGIFFLPFLIKTDL